MYIVSSAEAFAVNITTGASFPTDTIQAIQHLVSRLGFQLQPTPSATSTQSPQAYYTNNSRSPSNNRNRGGSRNRGGRGNHNQGGGQRNSNQFNWASNQNTVYGTCNRCGIGHIPS